MAPASPTDSLNATTPEIDGPEGADGALRALAAFERTAPLIDHWSVIGNGRISGRVFNRPLTVDGMVITTSPVRYVAMVGEPPLPVAVTRSGSTYLLGVPAEAFGERSAREFVARKSGAARPPQGMAESGSDPATAVINLAG